MTMTSRVRWLACLSVLMASPAFAGDLDLTLPASTTPIGFATPDRSATLPAGDYDRNGLDTQANGSGFDVSGSVTTGIGYSKGHGNSNFSAAHLRVAHDGDSGHDGRPSRVSLDIDVGTARGPGFIGPYGYGGGYGGYGPYDDGYGGAEAFRADESRSGDSDIRFRGRR